MLQRLGAAIELARGAGGEVTDAARTGLESEVKDDDSIVTNADRRSNEFILSGLKDRFPEDAILSEESGTSGTEGSDWLWVVDPLDGTRAFAEQIAGFSVMIGLMRDWSPVLGVVYDPLDGWLYHAVAGEGAFAVRPGESDAERVEVSDHSDGDAMPLICSPSVNEELREAIIAQMGLPRGYLINSVGIKVGLLVRQEGDIYFNHHSVSYWDTVAPLLIAREAGAEATMLDGRPFTYDRDSESLKHRGPSVVTNGTRHEEIRRDLERLVERYGAS